MQIKVRLDATRGNYGSGNHGNTSGIHGNTSGNQFNTSGNHGNTNSYHGKASGDHSNTNSNHGKTSGNHSNTSGNNSNTSGNHGNTKNIVITNLPSLFLSISWNTNRSSRSCWIIYCTNSEKSISAFSSRSALTSISW